MYNFFLLIGAVLIVVMLIYLRLRCSPVLHPDAELFVNLLSMNHSKKKSIKLERKN
jgi:hypothetical protein